MKTKYVIVILLVISILFLAVNDLLAFDFQYEYAPFTKEQIYTINANDDNGITREYDVIGTFTYRYTTERGDSNLEKYDLEKFINVLPELKIDLTNNHHIIQSEPLNPISFQTESGIIIPQFAKFYRHTATCNALRLRAKERKVKDSSVPWKQNLLIGLMAYRTMHIFAMIN